MLSFYIPFIKQWFGIAKKILLVVLVFSVVLALFAHFMQKDRIVRTHDPIKDNRAEIYKFINDPELNKTTQGKISIALYKGMMCGLIGETCSNNPNDADKNFNKSAFGFVTKLIITPIANPPASGVMWAMDGLKNAGLVPKIFASEGLGFGAIQPFSKIWVAFRDLAYVALVLIIIAAGFMIMFRMKLNPQTVISLENALPKIVVTLIIITFSFAIAGFLIDLMYLAIAIIIAVLQPAGGYDLTQFNQRYMQAGPMEILGGIQKTESAGFITIFWELPNALLNLIPFIGGTIRAIGSFAAVFWIAPELGNKYEWIGRALSSAFGLNVGGEAGLFGLIGGNAGVNLKEWASAIITPSWYLLVLVVVLSAVGTLLVPLAVGLLIFLTVILIFFRIFFMLLTTYGKILLSVILAPIFLLFEAIPGQSAFSNWIKGLIAELIIFPVVITIFILGRIIIDQSAAGNLVQFPFLFGIDPKSFSYILGMLFLFMTPDLVMAVKKFIVPKPGLLDSLTSGLGIGAFFAGATTGLSTGMGEVSKYGGFAYYFKPMGSLLQKLGLKDIINVGDPHHQGRTQ